MKRCWVCLVAMLSLALLPSAVLAHKASDAYFKIDDGVQSNTLALQITIAVKDIDSAIEVLDANNDRQLSWGEIKAAIPDIARWLNGDVVMSCAAKPQNADWQFESLEQRSDGAYVRFGASLPCAKASSVAIDYKLFAGLDASHRLLLNSRIGGVQAAAVLAPQVRSGLELRASSSSLAVIETATGPQTLFRFIPEGIHHILSGYDHLAFLLALLLPINLFVKADPSNRPLARASYPGLGRLLRTITGFTIGHSITLLLANLDVISVSPNWVEPAIAASIAISAALNIWPVKWLRGDVLALAFGLVHGLGFSGAMREADVSGSLLLWGIGGFNIGVELGQLLLLVVWAASTWIVLRVLAVSWKRYQTVVVKAGSWALIGIASYWFIQRV